MRSPLFVDMPPLTGRDTWAAWTEGETYMNTREIIEDAIGVAALFALLWLVLVVTQS